MTFISWLPLVVFALLIVAAEVGSMVTDRAYQARRELQTYGGGILNAFGAMELRGMLVRQQFLATEEPGGARTLMRRYNVLFWGFVVALSAVAALLAWPFWTASIIIGLIVASQTVDLRGFLGLRRTEETASDDRTLRRFLLHALAALTVIGGVFLLGWGLDPHRPIDELWIGVVAAVVGLALLYLAIAVRLVAERFGSVIDAGSRFGEDASRDDILFLRSFGDDALPIRAIDAVLGRLGLLIGYRTRFEQYLANLVQRQQQLIAIGKPGERLPALGAVRTYFVDDEWQDAIDSTVRRVGSIVMVAAGTGGFEWELNLLARTGNLSKTVILIPPLEMNSGIERMQDLMVRLGIYALDGITDEEFDEWGAVFILSLTAIGFSKGGRPIFYLCMSRDWAGYAATMVRALAILSGRINPPKHGELANASGREMPLSDQ